MEQTRGTIPAFESKEMHLISDARVTKQRDYETYEDLIITDFAIMILIIMVILQN